MNRSEKWQIKLEAETSLLGKLSAEFCNPELRIFHDSDCWFLESTYLNSDDSSEIYTNGEKLIDYLNHTLWLYAYRPNSINSNGYYLLASTGERVMKFLAIETITAPIRLIVYSNDIPSRISLDLFSAHEKVREALAFFNKAEIDWFTLYKIYETVRDDDPNSPVSAAYKALIDEAWNLKKDSKRFRDAANWHRHSAFNKKNERPVNPMTLSEAKQFVRQVLINWLEHKSTIKDQTQSN